MSDILDKIFADKKLELQETIRKVSLSQLKDSIAEREPTLDVSKALKSGEDSGTRLIAEIKPRSPFKGALRENFDLLEIAKAYDEGGAAAISVLTESRYFGGDIENLSKVKAEVTIPCLRKDFIFAEYQVYEARAFGGDLFLLIATWLDPNQLSDLLCLGKELGLTALVETHNEKDVEMAYNAGAHLLGINNRDLKTGKTDLNIARRLIKMASYDPNVILVCESGIHGREEIEEFEGRGAHAFLVGESLMRSENISEKLASLLGKENEPSSG